MAEEKKGRVKKLILKKKKYKQSIVRHSGMEKGRAKSRAAKRKASLGTEN